MTGPRRLRFCGTGGAGVTTVAAATALARAATGDGGRVLLWSREPAAVVAALLEVAVGEEPRAVRPGLWVAAGGSSGWGEAATDSADWDLVVLDGGPLAVDEAAGDGPPGGGALLRVVVSPTRVGVAALRRTAVAAALHGRPLDQVVVNRVLPGGRDPWLVAAGEAQAAHVVAAERAVPGVVVRTLDHRAPEPVGLEALEALGRALEDGSGSSASPVEAPLRIERVADGYALTVVLPPVDRSSIQVDRSRTHLRLAVEGVSRALALPDSLRRRAVSEAAYRDGRLVIHFADP